MIEPEVAPKTSPCEDQSSALSVSGGGRLDIRTFQTNLPFDVVAVLNGCSFLLSVPGYFERQWPVVPLTVGPLHTH